MGPERSRKGLLKLYTDQGITPPSISTVDKWASRFGWRAGLAEHDCQVAGETSSKAIEVGADALEGVKPVTSPMTGNVNYVGTANDDAACPSPLENSYAMVGDPEDED